MSIEGKAFHIGDILSVITGRLVSPNGMQGLYDILSYMTSENIYTHQIPRAMDECKPYLLKQFIVFTDKIIEMLIENLDALLKTSSGEIQRHGALELWISKIIKGEYGIKCHEYLMVRRMTPKDNPMDPIDELIKMTDESQEIFIVPNLK